MYGTVNRETKKAERDQVGERGGAARWAGRAPCTAQTKHAEGARCVSGSWETKLAAPAVAVEKRSRARALCVEPFGVRRREREREKGWKVSASSLSPEPRARRVRPSPP